MGLMEDEDHSNRIWEDFIGLTGMALLMAPINAQLIVENCRNYMVPNKCPYEPAQNNSLETCFICSSYEPESR